MTDWNEVEQLLDVVTKASGHPKLKPLVDAAMRELEQIAEEVASAASDDDERSTDQATGAKYA